MAKKYKYFPTLKLFIANKMKVLTVKIEEPKNVVRKLFQNLENPNAGKSIGEERVLTFTSVDKLFKTLTPARWKIIRALQSKEFKSIRELAQFLKRDYSNVWKDLRILNDLGIVEIEETQKGYRVYIPYERIVIEFPKLVKV